ncbi:hypothetical protein BC835DRAFT_297614 [Cytidiella melzeri]|nr:hypothetical protein BC835DRAFT_297614 [Cytidiella melzeri]
MLQSDFIVPEVRQKRKRINSAGSSQERAGHAGFVLNSGGHGVPVSLEEPLDNGRHARKQRQKRQKRERQAAGESDRTQEAGISAASVPPTHSLVQNIQPQMHNTLPPKPAPVYSSLSPASPSFPLLSTMPFSALQTALSIPMYQGDILWPQRISQSPILVPLPIWPDVSLDLHPEEQQPQEAPRRQIGMPPDPKPSSKLGLYELPLSSPWNPDPTRSLVMEVMPRKFRNFSFVFDWARTVCPPGISPHVELDVKWGRALIEFPTAELAMNAWKSPRLHGGGREHIRTYWYRPASVGTNADIKELEDGEIADGKISKHVPSTKLTKRKKSKVASYRSAAPEPQAEPPFATSHSGSVAFIGVPSPSGEALVESSPPKDIGRQPALPSFSPIFSPKDGKHSVLAEREDGMNGYLDPTTLTVPPVHSRPPPHRLLDERLQSPPRLTSSPFSLQLDMVEPYTLRRASIASSATLLPDEAMDFGLGEGHSVLTPDLQSAPDGSPYGDKLLGANSASVPSVSDDSPAAGFSHKIAKSCTDASGNGSLQSLVPEQSLPLWLAVRPVSTAPRSVHALSSPALAERFSHTGEPHTVSVFPSPTPPAVYSSASSTSLPTSDTSVIRGTSLSGTPASLMLESMGTPQAIKQTLLARQKQLEEAITRTREALASLASASGNLTGTPTAESDNPLAKPLGTIGEVPSLSTSSLGKVSAEISDEGRNGTKEDDLRRLVQSSKKLRAAAARPSGALKDAGQPSAPLSTTTAVSDTTSRAATLDLDKLATSFISKTIQTVCTPSDPSSTCNTPKPQPPKTEKELLVAKQKLLQQKIVETKAFMAQYSAAPTKSHKAHVMKRMDERMRALDEEMNALKGVPVLK